MVRLSMSLFTWVTPPFVIAAGICVFLCLVGTATLGMMVMKGNTKIPFSWHVNLARLTILLAVVHAFLAMAMFAGW
jgi:hypothetical protein